MVERHAVNVMVVGSSPTRGASKEKSMICGSPHFARRPNWTGFWTKKLIGDFVFNKIKRKRKSLSKIWNTLSTLENLPKMKIDRFFRLNRNSQSCGNLPPKKNLKLSLPFRKQKLPKSWKISARTTFCKRKFYENIIKNYWHFIFVGAYIGWYLVFFRLWY